MKKNKKKLCFGLGLLITKGLIENLSPSLSLASLNEVAMYSAYLATVLCEREEVQYQTWKRNGTWLYLIFSNKQDWSFMLFRSWKSNWLTLSIHHKNNPRNKKSDTVEKSEEKVFTKTSHQSGQRLCWIVLSLVRNAKHVEEMCLHSTPLISENNGWQISPNFLSALFCSIFAKKVGGSKNIPEKVRDKSWDRN